MGTNCHNDVVIMQNKCNKLYNVSMCVCHTVYKTSLHMSFSVLVPDKDQCMWSKHCTIAIYCTYSTQHHYKRLNILSNNFAFNKVFVAPKVGLCKAFTTR